MARALPRSPHGEVGVGAAARGAAALEAMPSPRQGGQAAGSRPGSGHGPTGGMGVPAGSVGAEAPAGMSSAQQRINGSVQTPSSRCRVPRRGCAVPPDPRPARPQLLEHKLSQQKLCEGPEADSL